MCGIVGIMAHNGTMPVGYQKIFKELLIANTLRGDDSTGVLSLVGKKKLLLYKDIVDGYALAQTQGYNEVVHKHTQNHRFLLGHNRAATAGSITKDEAHPFTFDKVIGVHNGTISSFGIWQNREPDMANFSVDSQKLYYLINKHGVDEVLKGIYGSYALVYYDRRTKTINFIRNRERPLIFAKGPNNSLFWASEKGMLQWILERNRIHNVVYEVLPEDTLWTYKISDTTKRAERARVGVVEYQHYNAGYRVNNPYSRKNKYRQNQRRLPTIIGPDNYYTSAEEEEDIDCRKEHLGKFCYQGFVGHKLIITGYLETYPFRKFVVHDAQRVDYNNFRNHLLKFKPKYWDKHEKQYVVAIADIQVQPELPKTEERPKTEDLIVGPHGTLVPATEFNLLVQHGCINCGETLGAADADDIYWTEEIEARPICGGCATEWAMMEPKLFDEKVH